MPLSDAQKSQLLANKGFDPSQWMVSDDEKSIIPISQQPTSDQPTLTTPTPSAPDVQVSPEEPSAAKSFTRHAIEAAPVAAASGIGAASTLAFLGGLGLDMTGVGALVGIPLTLAGAAGAGYGAHKLLQATEPEEAKQEDIAEEQAHPIASELGGVATLPLGGFNPSPTGFVKALGTIPKLASGVSLTAEEAGQLANVGTGAVIGAAQPIASGDLSPSDIATGAAEGALFNKPNALGRSMGFKPVESGQLSPENLKAQLNTPDVQTEPSAHPVSPSPAEPVSTTLPDVNTTIAGASPNIPFTSNTSKNIRGSKPGPIERYAGNVMVTPGELAASESEGLPPIPEPTLKNQSGAFQQFWNQITSQQSPARELMDKSLQSNPRFMQQSSPVAETELSQEVNTGLKKENIPTVPTKGWYNTLKNFVKQNRKIQTVQNPELKGPSGQPILGEAIPRVGNAPAQNIINPNLAAIDTQPHEAFHTFLQDLGNSKNKQDIILMGKFNKAVETNPEFQAMNTKLTGEGKPPVDAHEFATSQQGLEFLKQQLNLSGENGAKRWWNDLRAHLSARFSDNTTLGDLRRVMNYKFVNDKPFDEYYKLQASKVPIVANQEEQKRNAPSGDIREKMDYSPEDLQKYKDASAKFAEFIKKEDVTSPEFQKNFKDFEDVRNKYNGMPPKNLQENSQVESIPDETPYNIIDTQTGQVVTKGIYKNRSAIRQAAEKRNKQYGSFRYSPQPAF